MVNKNSKKYHQKTIKNVILVIFFFVISALGIVIGNQSLRAQIQDIYNEKTDQIAGISSLMSAVVSGDIDGVRFFGKAGKSLVNQRNIGGATALHIAARERNLEIIRILIEDGANVNIADNEGWTPLMRAAMAGDRDIVTLLLQKGAEAQTLNSLKESTIIHSALSDCNDCLQSMFENFNFIKLMDNKLLQDQLNQAYVIARNHDNQIGQSLLERYLDQAMKMSMFKAGDTGGITNGENKYHLISEPSEQAVKPYEEPKYEVKEIPLQDFSEKKKFKFVAGQGQQVESQKVESGNKIIIKKKDILVISQPVENAEKAPEALGTRFKLKQGPAGQVIKLLKQQALEKQIHEENKQNIIDAAGAVLEQQPQAVVNPQQSESGRVFKLQKGEDAKILPKKKVVKKKVIKVEVAPVQPEAAKSAAVPTPMPMVQPAVPSAQPPMAQPTPPAVAAPAQPVKQ